MPVARPGFQWPVTPPVFKKLAWAIVFVTTAAVTAVLLPAPAPSMAAMADLPPVKLGPAAMPCEALTSRRRQLDCRLPRARFHAMSTAERTDRLAMTILLAREGGFERLTFVDVGGTWASHSTELASARPRKARVEVIDLAPTPLSPTSTPPSSIPPSR